VRRKHNLEPRITFDGSVNSAAGNSFFDSFSRVNKCTSSFFATTAPAVAAVGADVDVDDDDDIYY
jgi:hypothetical protein